LRDVLTRVVEGAVQKFSADYAEVRAQKLHKTMVTLEDGRIEAAKQGIERGAALRVLVGGAWGFGSIASFDVDALTDTIGEACKMARAATARRKSPVKLARTEPVDDKIILKPRKDPSEISVEDKINTALTTSDVILSYDKRVRSCTLNYLDLTGTDYFINNEGACIEQGKLYVWLGVNAVAREMDVFSFSREAVGSTAGYEVFDVETPQKIGELTARRAVEQLNAKSPKGGTYPVVLGQNVVGTFVHEAFGHLAEADLTLSGSVLCKKLGKKVGSDVVSIYDDGTISGAFGSFVYDDEGVAAQRTSLVKDGVVVGLMHNRETAQQFDARPTGNARAEDFRVGPMVRMRNTFIEPKDYSFEELIEGMDFGYYLKSFRGGQANLDGTFQVGIQESYEVVDGEVGEPVRNASISRSTLETLLKVDAVGKNFQFWSGVCGKGQSAFACSGGAPARLKAGLVGGCA
jgi:TldD protein